MKVVINKQLLFISLIASVTLAGLTLCKPAMAGVDAMSGTVPPSSAVDIRNNCLLQHPFGKKEDAYRGNSQQPPQAGAVPYKLSTLVPPTAVQYSRPESEGPVGYEHPKEQASLNMGTQWDGLDATEGNLVYILNKCVDRLGDQMADPNNSRQMLLNMGQAVLGAGGNALGSAANDATDGALNGIMGGSNGGGGSGGGGGGAGGGGGGGGAGPGDFSGVGGLINIANEASGVPTSSWSPFKIVPQAVWMVQQMYKAVFIPMAILFLLVGAVITQTKAQISVGFNLKPDDASSPFEGILRAMVALFLVFSTQLIVSYSIDVGNSMAASVANYVDLQAITTWAQQLMYVPQGNMNALMPSSSADGGGGGGEGLASDQPAASAVNEQQSFLSQGMKSIFNTIIFLFSMGLVILGCFQLVYMCYLYLLGPLSAAFYAWPTVQGKLFRTVFGNWLNAVIVLSLWRFYWMVILAIMTLRLLYIADHGGIFNLEFEVAVFTCLIGLMFYIPMSPWNFDPAQAYMTAKDIGEQLTKGAGGGGGGDGDGGGGGGGGEDEDLDPKAAQGQQAHPQPTGEHNHHDSGTVVPPSTREPSSGESELDPEGDELSSRTEGPPRTSEEGTSLAKGDDTPTDTKATDSSVSDVPLETAPIDGTLVADAQGPAFSTMPEEPGVTTNENVTKSADFAKSAEDFSPIFQASNDSSPSMAGEGGGWSRFSAPTPTPEGVAGFESPQSHLPPTEGV